MLVTNPYQKKTIRETGWTPPSGSFSLPPIAPTQGAGNASLDAYAHSPEDLERMIGEGWAVHEDGSMSPPGSFGGGFGQPSPGAMNAALPGPPPLPAPAAAPVSPFAAPVFDRYNAVANPAPKEADPFTVRDPFKEPKPGPSLSVPGGASINNGMPLAAPAPVSEYTQADDTQGGKPTGNPYGGRIGRKMAAKTMPKRGVKR